MTVPQRTQSDPESPTDERDPFSEDGEWQLVDEDTWWRTSSDTPSWSFTPTLPSNHHRAIPLSPFCRFPFAISSFDTTMDEDDCSLNLDFVGCRMAQAVVASYEAAVGFDFEPFPKIKPEDRGLGPPLNLTHTEQGVEDSRDRWREAVEELLSSDHDGSVSLSSSTTDSNGSSQSAESFAMPATPVTKASYATMLLKNVSPVSSITDTNVRHPTPSKTLNAFASSFVPSAAASTLSNFTFPTLNPPNKSTEKLTTVKIKKDDQGFFTGVQVDDPPQKATPLPPCLQEPSPRRRSRTSKTRELVDRLRSTQAGSLAAKCISHSPSPTIFHDLTFIEPRLSVSEDGGDRDRESSRSSPSVDEDDDGWIDVGIKVPNTNTKAKRAHDLFLALTRRKTDPASPNEAKEGVKDKSKLAAPNSDGWIEGLPSVDPPVTPPSLPNKPSFQPAPPKSNRKKQHAPKHSSNAMIPSTTAPPPHPPFAAPPYMMPMINPAHMPMIPATSVPTPVPFFFSPTAPTFHPMPLQYPPATTFMAPSPFISAPMHPMATGHTSKRQINAMYPAYHSQARGRASISPRPHSFGKVQ